MAANSRYLAGAGLDLQAGWGLVQLKAALAWPTGGGTVTSIPLSAHKTPTLRVQAWVRI